LSTDAACSGSSCVYDWQEAQIRNTSGATLASVFKTCSNAQAWTQVTLDLTQYAGQNVVLWFNVHQDGANPADDTAMYLDDVAVTNSQPGPPTVPAAPTNVVASAGNSSATVSWTAPSNGGSQITSYTVTPFIGGTAQPPTTVTGSPPATSTTITGLTNGTTYTFTVSATNSVGTGPASAPSNAVTPSASTPPPAFVQGVTAHGSNRSSLAVVPPAAITAGNRLIVEVGVRHTGNPTAQTVTDSAGNTYTEVLHFVASDGTEQSIWTAPITAGGGTRPTITVTPSATANIGVAVLEYSGLSAAAGVAAVDQSAQASGTTGGAAATVSSGATAPTTAGSELAVGFYTDGGYHTTPTAGTGWTMRKRIANAGDMDLLAEDSVVAAAATPNATASTGANTVWLMSVVVFKHA
jgi:hypothetical protein